MQVEHNNRFKAAVLAKMGSPSKMKWGLICSVEDPQQVNDFVQFGEWMVVELERAAKRLHLGHSFEPTPNFAFHATPGSLEETKLRYQQVAERHPEVSYVIHILPSKNSVEFKLFKEATTERALIGQGVLAENALNYFECYQTDQVMENMNQWIARRLAQITARNQQRAGGPGETKKLRDFRLHISSEPVGERRPFAPSSNSHFFAAPLQQPNWGHTDAVASDLDYSVGVVLHKENAFSAGFGRPMAPFGRPNSAVSPPQRLAKASGREVMRERESELLVKGFPPAFNKFQIASLFPDFRPLHVQYLAPGQALVQFANKYQAAQAVRKYNRLPFKEEDFTLEVSFVSPETELVRSTLQAKLEELRLQRKMSSR